MTMIRGETPEALKARLIKENSLGAEGRLERVTLAGAVFCSHGNEYCHMCTCDHRGANNTHLGVTHLDPKAERQPISNAGNSWTVCQDGKTVECADHAVLGCRLCFDFEKVIRRQLSSKAKPR